MIKMERHPVLEEMLNGLFPEREKRLKEGRCVICGEKVNFNEMTEIERREYDVSGMCKKCQQEVFKHYN